MRRWLDVTTAEATNLKVGSGAAGEGSHGPMRPRRKAPGQRSPTSRRARRTRCFGRTVIGEPHLLDYGIHCS